MKNYKIQEMENEACLDVSIILDLVHFWSSFLIFCFAQLKVGKVDVEARKTFTPQCCGLASFETEKGYLPSTAQGCRCSHCRYTNIFGVIVCLKFIQNTFLTKPAKLKHFWSKLVEFIQNFDFKENVLLSGWTYFFSVEDRAAKR